MYQQLGNLPFILVEELHAEYSNDPADDLDNDDANHDGQAATIYSR
jgi:hypothetical protein